MQGTIIDILSAIHCIDHAPSSAAIVKELQAYTAHYGFTACLIARLPASHSGHWQDLILCNGWPIDWYAHYLRKKFYRHDPCIERCRTTSEPFFWRDLDQHSLSRPALNVMKAASIFGLCDGICIPFHAALSEPGTVSFAGKRLDLPPHALLVLHALSHHAFYSALRLAGQTRRAEPPALSEREREILQWTAAGKTAWEASQILGISAHTINTHRRNIRQKYHTSNNAQTVIEAIRRHQIHL
ncbi:helix-turn-helix transcriptional regulator [Labrys miyagiensis]|uniref:helix-turn-helix transcriptional regulator n=1 Tax=Labrys miyagiensis TaxID=346912 RepID=UPI0024E10A18|nr:LuxR family transcriptional regulator [Labrys miyagiensis]